jgi:hypothetical protein
LSWQQVVVLAVTESLKNGQDSNNPAKIRNLTQISIPTAANSVFSLKRLTPAVGLPP